LLRNLFSDSDEEEEEDAQTSQSNAIPKEIDEYLNASFPNYKSGVLKFWYHYAKIYPNIAKLAKKYLAVPATQFESERNFSFSVRTLDRGDVRDLVKM